MSAKSNVPWSVKGIDPDARSVAKELARQKGMTLGEFITDMIRQKGLDAAGEPSEQESPREGPKGKVVSGVTTDQLHAVVDTLNRLNERLKSAELQLSVSGSQSREVMGGLNRGLETVFERVKRLEAEARGEQSEQVHARLEKLETAAEKNSWVKSLVALERALSTLVEQVETSREDADTRLTRNEELIEAIKARLDQEDEVLEAETRALNQAIDSTSERLTEAERRVQEALSLAREASESHDETFIERTSQRLQLLAGEIKRTSDQIRTLEGSVGRLSEKIEAGEERSAEGIARVAQSVETLRQSYQEASLAKGEDTPLGEIKRAVEEAGERAGDLDNAFAAVVGKLEERNAPEERATVPPAAPPLPQDAFLDDFKSRQARSELDDQAFDRVFDDPLKLGGGSIGTVETAPVTEPDSETEPPKDELDHRFSAAPLLAEDTARPSSFFDRDPEPSARKPEPLPGWDGEPSNPFAQGEDDDEAEVRFEGDGLFEEAPLSFNERLREGLGRLVAQPVENNPTLGWLLIAVIVGAIGLTAYRLIDAPGEEPMVMEEMTSPSGWPGAPGAARTSEGSDAEALYTAAKTRLAAARSPDETAAAIGDLRRAAEAGSSLAQHDLGELYLNGEGVPRNDILARSWFDRAAENGHLRAIHRLAFLDATGVGGPLDTDAALLGFERAANAGLVASMFNLGRFYDPSQAFLASEERSAQESYYWFRLASSRGDDRAGDEANRVSQLLAPEEILEADGRVQTWRQRPLRP
ncbi:hypothetical protein [Parvularcula maris]|uniref:Sel1 repeat family protein n=1 Tax=Parvularcula maris TaxID=2965077 RepID=A0A9X2L970_9PROT|nr:hypothetical protein [Parvularcula maris]MCQ8185406.1 hypothetical protein [Parvularcula maris]